MTLSLSEALAAFARGAQPEYARVFAMVPTTAPAQRERMADWLAQCVARQPAATTDAALAAAVRGLVTLRNAQLTYDVVSVRPGARAEAVITGDLGGAVALGNAMVGLLRCVAAHDPALAQRLLREARGTDFLQRGRSPRQSADADTATVAPSSSTWKHAGALRFHDQTGATLCLRTCGNHASPRCRAP